MRRAIVSLTATLAFASIICTCIAADSQAETAPVSSFPFPDDSSDFTLVTTLDRVRSLTAQLERTLGSVPIRVKDADECKAVYKVWKRALFSAIAVRQTEGDTELMISTLAALYRQGMNLGVETCREKAVETLERALEMYPDSMLVNWQVAYLYEETPETFPKAEAALMKLRQLLGTDKNFEVERRLAQIYAACNDKAKALAQVDRCLAMRADDARLLELKKSLKENEAK